MSSPLEPDRPLSPARRRHMRARVLRAYRAAGALHTQVQRMAVFAHWHKAGTIAARCEVEALRLQQIERRLWDLQRGL
jgi:hypothetical protein